MDELAHIIIILWMITLVVFSIGLIQLKNVGGNVVVIITDEHRLEMERSPVRLWKCPHCLDEKVIKGFNCCPMCGAEIDWRDGAC